jgi:hypothetical protein
MIPRLLALVIAVGLWALLYIGFYTVLDLFTRGCQHGRTTWPVGGWQCCLDCGARRTYCNPDGTLGMPGPWLRMDDTRTQRKAKDICRLG